MKLEIATSEQVFTTLKTEWNALLKQSDSDLIFLTHEWQQAWWQAYSPGQLWVITGRSDDGTLVGIAPWFIDQKHGERVVRTVGCVDVTDYLGIIAARDTEAAFFSALADLLASSTDVFDRLNLCNIQASAALLHHLPDQLKAHGFEVEIELQEVCPIITLPSSWDEYLANLNKKQRHELRRKIRRASGQSDWYIVGSEHNLDKAIDQFLRLMAASSDDKAEFLKNDQNVYFFRSIAPVLMAQGWLQLNFLTVDGTDAAAYLNFDYNNRIMVYNSGQDSENYGQLSPGIVLLGNNIRHAIEHGRSEFDFLRGNETYKYQMGGVDTEVYKLKARLA